MLNGIWLVGAIVHYNTLNYVFSPIFVLECLNKIKMSTTVRLVIPVVFLFFQQTIFGQTMVETLQPNFDANGAISIDKEGDIFVSEYGIFTQEGGNGNRLFKISPKGIILDSLNSLSGPMGSAKDSKGNLFVNNDNNMRRGVLLKVEPSGTKIEFAEISGWPSGMIIDKQDNLYITNYNTGKIDKVDSQGKVSILCNDERLLGAVGIDFDSSGNLIVSNFYTAKLFSVTKNGRITEIAEIKGAIVQGWGLGYLTVVDDVIYATGIAVNKIFKISLDGVVEVFAGNGTGKSIDGEALSASFSNPNGIASDKNNKILYISEYGPLGSIRKIHLN